MTMNNKEQFRVIRGKGDLTACITRNTSMTSLATNNRNFILRHMSSSRHSTRRWNRALHVVQCEKAVPSWDMSRQHHLVLPCLIKQLTTVTSNYLAGWLSIGSLQRKIKKKAKVSNQQCMLVYYYIQTAASEDLLRLVVNQKNLLIISLLIIIVCSMTSLLRNLFCNRRICQKKCHASTK